MRRMFFDRQLAQTARRPTRPPDLIDLVGDRGALSARRRRPAAGRDRRGRGGACRSLLGIQRGRGRALVQLARRARRGRADRWRSMTSITWCRSANTSPSAICSADFGLGAFAAQTGGGYSPGPGRAGSRPRRLPAGAAADLLRGDLSRRICARAGPRRLDPAGHQRRLVRRAFRAVPAPGAGPAARRRTGPAAGARRPIPGSRR